MMKKEIDSHYRIVGSIGEGAYSQVFKAIDQRTDKIVALKRVKIRKAEEGLPKEFVREIETLQRLLHRNIVRIEKVFIGKSNINIVYPFCVCDLDNLLNVKMTQPLSMNQIQLLMKMLLSGLNKVHQIGLMHRDLKPSNLLLALEPEIPNDEESKVDS